MSHKITFTPAFSLLCSKIFIFCIATFLVGINLSAQCVSPTSQASDFYVTSSTIENASISWVRGNGEGVLVIGKANSPVNEFPENAISYNANASFGAGTNLGNGNFVIYIGSGTNVQISNISTNTTYHFAVFEFNNSANPCFNLINPAVGFVYCRPSTGNGGNITNVAISHIASGTTLLNNSNGLNAAGNYQYINNQQVPVLVAGEAYSFSITRAGTGQRRLNVLIDYNMDGFLDLQAASADGETIYNLAPPNQNTITFDYTIPVNATPGSKYLRIRSFGQNPAVGICLNTDVAGETEDYWITISADPLPPGCNTTVSPAEPFVCEGGSLVLQASGASTYEWSPAAGLSCVDCPNPTASPSETTTYEVIGIDGDCRDTTFVTVNFNFPDSIVITQSPANFFDLCNGPISLSIPSNFTNVIWSNLEQGQNQIVAGVPGMYSVSAVGPSGCPAESASITIIESPTPIVNVQPNGMVTICQDEPLTLMAASGFIAYEWSNQATSQSIAIDQAGIYFVNATASNGCIGQSEQIVATTLENPIAAFSYQNLPNYTVEFFNESQNADSFLWIFSPQDQSELSNPTFTFPFNSTFPVTLIAYNACGSDTITLSITNLINANDKAINENTLNIFPNPMQQELFIQTAQIEEPIQIELLDLTGKIVFNRSSASSNLHRIDLNDIPAGCYLLKLTGNNFSMAKKVLKL